MLNFNKVYFVLFPASVLCNSEELQMRSVQGGTLQTALL